MGYANIAKTVYNYVPDTLLQLGGAEYRRKLSVGTNWYRIRIGFLAAVPIQDPAQNANILNAQCYFGLSSSIGDGVSAYNTTGNFIGASLMGNANSPATLTYNTDSLSFTPYYTAAAAQAFAKANGSFFTATAGSATNWAPSGRGHHRRWPYVLDIARGVGGAGTYTISLYCYNAQYVDWRPDDLFALIDSIVAAPTLSGITTAAYINGATIGWSEASGPLDTISIWNRLVAYPLEISAIGASILDQPTAGYTQQGGMVELFVPTVGSAGTFSATPPVWNYGTLVSGTLTPVYASSPIVAQGSCGNLTPHYYLSGTSCGPADDFQSYGTGTVLSGITLNGGYGWASPAVCYAW